jgi:peptidoglycan/LPS O-acetylase OafA/YrhL
VTTPEGTPPPPARSSGTTTADRLRDALALLLVVIGLALTVAAFIGNRRLASQPIVVAAGQSAFSLWMRNYYMEFAGYALIVAGVLVGIVSFAMHARRGRQ